MGNKSIVFFSNSLTSRLSYVTNLVFQDLLGLTLVFTQNLDDYTHSELPKINYSQTPLSNLNELFIKNQSLLFETDISKKKIDTDFSYLRSQSPLQFDVLAAIFLLVTRYEEYAADASVFDSHNRFPAKRSIAYKYGFLQKPIVNQWVMQINNRLNTLFPQLKTSLPEYRYQPSFDIDMPWRYKNKGFLRTLGGFLKDVLSGHFFELKNRFDILRGVKDDPDFTFDYIFDVHRGLKHQPIFFILLGNHAKFDKNPSEYNMPFQKIIRYISDQYVVGLHPSYRSNTHLTVLEMEKARFERLTRTKLLISRQHFLKLRFPETYQRLVAVGIRQDYSMGYADDIGFRASIATPFKWFDLANNVVSDLLIFPFQVMDVTLKDYLHLTPEEASDRVVQLLHETKAVGGTFISLWHNSSFSDTEGWQNWRSVYEKMLKSSI